MEVVNREIKNKEKHFDKILEPSCWTYEARTEGCKAQDWHQAKKGYLIVMPLFPANYDNDDKCTYSMSVIRGSHKCREVENASTEDEAHINNMLHLDMKVGQTLILDSKLIHRGGPSSRWNDMFCSTGSTDSKIGAFKNLAIHGYLRCAGDDELDLDDEITFRDISLSQRYESNMNE